MSDVVQYKFLSLVGEGGFGKVYRARMQVGEFEKDVAIKLLSDPNPPPSLLERFRDEAKILGLIRDRAIVRVEPPTQISGRWAVVMEFVDGVSCGLMLGHGRLPAGVAVEIVGEVARALHAAYHQEGPEGQPLQLLHRDVKPENIQITPSGDVRLLDFGIARANFAAREFKTRHSLGGTPGYIAPERLNRVEVPEGDVFSLGVVLHELVTGDRPKHPPTVEVDTQIQIDTDPEGDIPFAGIQVSDEELEAPPDLHDDPLVMSVLRFAAWMRAYDSDTRPSAREVEEACRQFRQKLPPPFFRNWAETHVPHRMELDADNMVGQVLRTENSRGAPMVTGRPITGPMSASAPSNATSSGGVAMGALLGSGVTLLLVIGVGAFAVAIVVALFMLPSREPIAAEGTPSLDMVARPDANPAPAEVVEVNRPPEPEEDDPLGLRDEPAPKPVVAPAAPAPKPPPVVAPPSGRASAEPEPAAPTVITLEGLGGTPSGTAEAIDAVPVRERPKGLLVLKTLPSQATVYDQFGRQVPRTGRGYEFEVGSHTVVAVSPSGERHPIPFKMSANQVITICYNFDTNSACNAGN